MINKLIVAFSVVPLIVASIFSVAYNRANKYNSPTMPVARVVKMIANGASELAFSVSMRPKPSLTTFI